MKSILSKAMAIAVIAACFTLNLQAASAIRPVADTAKMSKMKMDKKMDKKMSKMKMKKMKMAKDTASKM